MRVLTSTLRNVMKKHPRNERRNMAKTTQKSTDAPQNVPLLPALARETRPKPPWRKRVWFNISLDNKKQQVLNQGYHKHIWMHLCWSTQQFWISVTVPWARQHCQHSLRCREESKTSPTLKSTNTQALHLSELLRANDWPPGRLGVKVAESESFNNPQHTWHAPFRIKHLYQIHQHSKCARKQWKMTSS